MHATPVAGQRARGLPDAWSVAILCILLAALWLLAHPYRGIRHDGALYIGQALLRLEPQAFAHDLFFAYGSQDRYSALSPLYAWTIGLFGTGPAARALLVLTQIAFAASALLLLHRLLGGGRLFWFCAASLFVMPAFYGGLSVFAYAENFLTARSFAEPLLLFALWLLLGGRSLGAMLACLAAGVFHPLLALPALALCWMHASLQTPRLWLLGLAAGLLPALAAFDIGPFAALLRSYDAEWLGIVRQRNAFVFPTYWGSLDWSRLAFDTVIAGLAALATTGAGRRLYISALAVCWAGILAAVIGADLLNNVLLTGLQLWRAHWILHLLAMASLPYVVWQAWQQGPNGRLASILLVAAAFGLRLPGGLAALVLGALLFAIPAQRITLSPAIRRGLLLAGGLAALAGIADQISLSYHSRVTLRGDEALDFGVAMLASPAGAALLLAATLWLVARARILAMLPALCLAATGIATWDQRSPWLRHIEDADHSAHPFLRAIPQQAQVYWFQDLLASWLVLHRSSYFTPGQGSGALFNRQTALEFERREEVVKPLEFQATTCNMMAMLTGDREACGISLEAARDVCAESGGLDFLVLENALPVSAAAAWTFAPTGAADRNFHLYDCRTVRAA